MSAVAEQSSSANDMSLTTTNKKQTSALVFPSFRYLVIGKDQARFSPCGKVWLCKNAWKCLQLACELDLVSRSILFAHYIAW